MIAMKAAYARLHILLAREAALGLVIRHGTAKSVCTLLWDRRKDTFTLGQWMRGRINADTSDLSPDGSHFLYSAQKYVSATWQMDSWTVVSRTPFLKAVAYYAQGWGGGWFVNDREYCVLPGPADPDDRESPEVRRVELHRDPKISLYEARLTRGGWAVDDLRTLRRSKEFVRPVGAGWELRHSSLGGYRLRQGELSANTRDWDWADLDGKRLVWAVKGCLWTGLPHKEGILGIKLLHDFNGMKFEPIAAPYEGGRPIQVRPTLPKPTSAVLRKLPRKPVRKKPNRSRVRPDADP
jgi:hypothetical protein